MNTLDKLEKLLGEATKALEFYADKESYFLKETFCADGKWYWKVPVEEDVGEIAREALKKLEEQ